MEHSKTRNEQKAEGFSGKDIMCMKLNVDNQDKKHCNKIDVPRISPDSDEESNDSAWCYMANVNWPKRKFYHSHDDFVDAVEDMATRIFSRGIPEDLLAINLISEIASSPYASQFQNRKKPHDMQTIKGVIQTLRDLEWIEKMKSPYERFRDLKIGKQECIIDFMKRLERFHQVHGMDEGNYIARAQEIKSVFFQGAMVPEDIQNICRMCLDLDLVAVEVAKILKEQRGTTEGGFSGTSTTRCSVYGHIKEIHIYNDSLEHGSACTGEIATYDDEFAFTRNAQNGDIFRQQLPGRLRRNNTSLNSQTFKWQDDPGSVHQSRILPKGGNSPMPNGALSYQQTFNSISTTHPYCKLPSMDDRNMKTRYENRPQVKPSPVSPTRAPKDMEFDMNCKHIMICLKCRLMNDHSSKTCPYRRFCSFCQAEGHDDMDHKRRVASLTKWQKRFSKQFGTVV